MNTNRTEGMTKAHVEALIACMLSTAYVDGVRPEELALIKAFHEQSADLVPVDFDSMQGTATEATTLLQRVPASVEFAEQVVLMSLMTGYADGHLSDAERAHVAGLAQVVGVSEARMTQLLESVKDSLIQSLSHLPDSASVAALVKTL